MKLTSADLHNLSEIAKKAALSAGDIISQYAKQEINHKLKGDTGSLAANIVTEVDFLAQEKILEVLSESIKFYDLAVLTEESEDDFSRLEKDNFWCIDPLDGTLYYQRKESGYAVSIALVSKAGEPLLGIIYDPFEDKLYNSFNPPVNNINNNSSNLTIYCDRYYRETPRLQDQFQERIEQLKITLNKAGYTSVKLDSQGGAVRNALAALINTPACYIKFPKKEKGGGCVWDYAATSCFFLQSNFIVSDMSGQKLNLNPKGSLYYNHCGIVFSSHKTIAEAIYQLL